MRTGWVYIMANKPRGTLYVGVTSDLVRRAWEHRTGIGSDFTNRYGLTRLVYAEQFDLITQAIQREKTIKHWPRSWKVDLIQTENPYWEDISGTLL